MTDLRPGAPTRLRGLLAWTLLGALCAVLVIVLLHQERVRRIAHAADMLQEVGRAGQDLSQGFLHLALGHRPDAPWQRETGVALLRQAIAHYERPLGTQPMNLPAAQAVVAHALRLGALVDVAAAGRDGDGLDLQLRLALHDLLASANLYDRELRAELQREQRRLDRNFAAAIAAVMTLLAGLFLFAFRAERARAAATATLAQRERQLRGLIDHSGAGMAVLRDGRIDYVNPRAVALLGAPLSAHAGRPARDLVTEQEQAAFDAALAGLAAPGAQDVTRLRHHLRRAAGPPLSVELHVSRAELNGRPAAIAIFHDVSERERDELAGQRLQAELEQRVAERTAELREATERALAADRIKSSFLATMSHELRTPLNSIIGFTGILLQRMAGPLNDEQGRQLRMVRDSARHLLALINDVLDISKIEAGQLDVAHEPYDLAKTIEQVLASVRPQAQAKGLALHAEIDPALRPRLDQACGDARRVGQVLLNLLGNAIKFTEQGSVTLLARPLAGGRVQLEVRDTGIGIEARHLATLFQPFRQIDTTITRSHEGTGLGLAISQRLAALMGGKIEARSTPGQGSSFTLECPLAVPATPHVDTAPTA